ncbi:MAG TPA: acyltransferase, partial [Stellaceae bacterium]|nr:acyltransferase [Stellaceae bacterium]
MRALATRNEDAGGPREHAILLDLLRVLAAICVLLVHTRGLSFVEFGALPPSQQTFFVSILLGLTRSGQEAVMAFFVLSGFLVGGQLIRRVMRGDFSLADYAIDRCSRILLPLIPACLLTAAINAFLLDAPDSPWDVIGSMVGLNGVLVTEPDHNGPLRTLAYEIWFYILGGALAYLIATCRRRVSLTAVLVVGVGVLVFTILRAPLLLFWMLGGLMALCVSIPYRKSIAALGCVIAATGAYFFEMTLPSHALHRTDLVSADTAEAMVAVGICLLLPACSQVRVRADLTPLTRSIAFVASISYSLYLIHSPVLFVLQRSLPKASVIDAQSLEAVGIRIVVVGLVTLVFYWLFERNTPALRR